jgi:APA family basic amino acid/polyamine antiporter
MPHPDSDPAPEATVVPETSSSSERSGSAVPSFGLATAVFVIVASMVGVGVLTTSGFTVYFVGSNQLMLCLWVLGGVIAICGALTQAELSASLPRTGGDYVFLLEAYGPLAAFLSGWVSFLIGFAGPLAAMANASATYLLAPLGLDEPSAGLATRGVATLTIVVLTLIHCRGRHWSIPVQGWTTAIKLVVLALFVAAGIAAGWSHRANLADRVPIDTGRVEAMLFSLVYIYYAYTGWNAASYLAGEIGDPQRRLPRAILLGTGVVVLLYLGLNVVFGFALSAADIQGLVKDPTKDLDRLKPIAQLAAQRLFRPGLANPFSVVVGLILISSVSAYILTGPRVVHAMAQAGQFPAFAGRLTVRHQTPAIATVLQSSWALVLLWSGSFEKIVVYSSVGLALLTMLTISSVYVLRWRHPDWPRPFRTPGYPVVPAVFLTMTAALTAAAFSERPWESLGALGTILLGVPFYYIWKSRTAHRVL